jgi:hypothetical protein
MMYISLEEKRLNSHLKPTPLNWGTNTFPLSHPHHKSEGDGSHSGISESNTPSKSPSGELVKKES